MTFKLENLAVLGTGAKTGKQPSCYTYFNEDNDTVTTAGFFKCNRLALKDQILVIKNDGTTNAWYNVKTVAAGVITVAANT